MKSRGVETKGFRCCCSCSTLFFASFAGCGGRFVVAGSLSRAGAVKEGVVVGTAVAAIMREGTRATLTARELVEVETDQGLSAWFSAGVLVRAILGWVVRAGAHRTMWRDRRKSLSKVQDQFYPRVG